mmetsp:Transcript_51831/g.104030  ORF Transcript_51831/g.104030 Transcript_51831/m.104030 type:complete len:92 (-) Transcript_51831:13-288(-)
MGCGDASNKVDKAYVKSGVVIANSDMKILTDMGFGLSLLLLVLRWESKSSITSERPKNKLNKAKKKKKMAHTPLFMHNCGGFKNRRSWVPY